MGNGVTGSRGIREGEGSLAFSPLGPFWPSTRPALIAFEQGDLFAFHEQLQLLTSKVLPWYRNAPTSVTLFLFDFLRTLAEATRNSQKVFPEEVRQALFLRLANPGDGAGLGRIIMSESERIATSRSAPSSEPHPIAARARLFIDQHLEERLSLCRVASALNVARTYLSALFRREFGMTLTEYIHQVRIEHAERLLLRGGLSMSEIASRTGYGSYRHFHRSFLKLRQVSPRRFLRDSDPPPGGGAREPLLRQPETHQ